MGTILLGEHESDTNKPECNGLSLLETLLLGWFHLKSPKISADLHLTPLDFDEIWHTC